MAIMEFRDVRAWAIYFAKAEAIKEREGTHWLRASALEELLLRLEAQLVVVIPNDLLEIAEAVATECLEDAEAHATPADDWRFIFEGDLTIRP
jgi:hypothetical protein